MPIVPDAKDWTWVLERPCPECGFDASTISAEDVAGLLRTNASEWQRILGLEAGAAADRGDQADRVARLRRRPSDDRWSALEYACHVRDVFDLYDYRLGLILTQDDPDFPDWNQDETAIEQRYNEQDPAAVSRDLVRGAETLARHFEAVDGDRWQRTGTRSDGARFTVDSFARYLIHDPIHHAHDVEQGLQRLDQA